jgi:hypothetical protein
VPSRLRGWMVAVADLVIVSSTTKAVLDLMQA